MVNFLIFADSARVAKHTVVTRVEYECIRSSNHIGISPTVIEYYKF